MIVVDNSVATKWVFAEDLTDVALALYTEHLTQRSPIIAPRLLPYEFTNVVLKRMKRDGMLWVEAVEKLELFHQMKIDLRPDTMDANIRIHRRAIEIAATYGLSATYDAHYVALAESLGCDLWTADSRLVRELGHRLPFVRSLESFVPAQ